MTRLHCVWDAALIQFFAKAHPLLNPSTIQELLRNINCLRSQVFHSIFTQRVIRRASVVASIQMIVQEKVHSFDVWHLESVNRLSFIFLWTGQLYDLVNCQEASSASPISSS
jgi:hypothetical protein